MKLKIGWKISHDKWYKITKCQNQLIVYMNIQIFEYHLFGQF